MPSEGPRNKWLEPQSLLGIAGFLMVGYTSFRDFQDDTGKTIGDLQVRVAVLEANNGQMDRRLDRLASWEREHMK